MAKQGNTGTPKYLKKKKHFRVGGEKLGRVG